jgi:glycosyltransferase involved in cell wall biosynthesis
MKVLHINDYYDRVGGAETILFSVLDALEEKGITNVIVHQHPTDVMTDWRRVYKVPGLGDPYSRQASIAADTLQRIIREEKPDLIQIHDICNPDVVEISRRYAPTIQSVYNHIFYCPGGGKYLPFLGRICERPFGKGCLVSAFLTHCNSIRPRVLLSSYHRSRRMLKNSRGLVFLTLSKYQAECLLQNGCPPEAVKVLPPLTDLPALHAPHGKRQVLFVGRVVKQKGLDQLIHALPYLDSSCRLIVCGDGPEVHTAKEIAQRLGIEARIDFLGWVGRDKLGLCYEASSVVVVPSVWPEPFGMVGIEAMSYGKPVVAFRVGGIPEWLEDGATGFLAKPYDVKEMAEKISYLLKHPDVAREMGIRGRKRVEQDFNKQKHISSLLEFYKEVMDDRFRSKASAPKNAGVQTPIQAF